MIASDVDAHGLARQELATPLCLRVSRATRCTVRPECMSTVPSTSPARAHVRFEHPGGKCLRAMASYDFPASRGFAASWLVHRVNSSFDGPYDTGSNDGRGMPSPEPSVFTRAEIVVTSRPASESGKVVWSEEHPFFDFVSILVPTLLRTRLVAAPETPALVTSTSSRGTRAPTRRDEGRHRRRSAERSARNRNQ